MSVRTMARVWDLSNQRGNDLLMLLAIADFADDDGNAYPSVQTLAHKCRMQARNANKVLAALRASGELEIRQNEGPSGTNRYRIVLSLPSLSKRTPPVQMDTLSKQTAPPVQMDPKPLSKRTDEPSVNRQQPSYTSDGFATFWEQYPKKVAKSQALKAWNKLKPTGQLMIDLMAGLTQHKASADWQKDGGRYIPHPATWLNDKRWEDEHAVTLAAKNQACPPTEGDTRIRFGVSEIFTNGMGWVPE